MANCKLCGEPMPVGEEMFHYHGYSGPCPKPPLERPPTTAETTWAYIEQLLIDECGLQPDCGLEQQRPNCINAIRQAIYSKAP